MQKPQVSETRFPYPHEVETPRGAEGWESMYAYFRLPSKESGPMRDAETKSFWFQDSLHHGFPLYPMDDIFPLAWQWALGANNSRLFVVPPALGIQQRIINGYVYITPVPVLDPTEIGRRVELFKKRAGHYYQNWGELYEKWKKSTEKLINEMNDLRFTELPEFEDEDVVLGGIGYTVSSYRLFENWTKLLNLMFMVFGFKQFEMLNLSYAAFLNLYFFCKEHFPGIPDQHVARMVSGISTILWKPDEICLDLAKLSIDLKLGDVFKSSNTMSEAESKLKNTPNGSKWLQEYDRQKYPWFAYGSGKGFHHKDPRWIDQPDVPFSFIRSYVMKLEKGEVPPKPTEKLKAEREQLAQEYLSLLSSESEKKTFQEYLGLARNVFFFAEEHQFYTDNWAVTVWFWKLRELGKVLVKHEIINEVDDVFCINIIEMQEILLDLINSWATGFLAPGPFKWPKEIERRKRILKVLEQWNPPPALGLPPEQIQEPFTVMLWGVTKDRVTNWLAASSSQAGIKQRELKGVAGAPGQAEGRARVITDVRQLTDLQEGEIIISPITTPNWTPAFTRAKAIVCDLGGIMSHAAIVSREYGLPAVVGTGVATRVIKTGQMIKVDGTNGKIELLEY